MQTAYIFSTLGYQVAASYIKSGQTKTDDPYVDSQEKVAIAMLGYSIAKAIFTILFIKTYKIMGEKVGLYIVWTICFTALIAHMVISLVYTNTYSNQWAIAGFFWGLQSAVLADKEETKYLNPIAEISEDNVDAFVLTKTLAAIIIVILGAFFKDFLSVWLMLFLFGMFIAIFVVTLLNECKSRGELDPAIDQMLTAATKAETIPV